jgi:hypothetical protein
LIKGELLISNCIWSITGDSSFNDNIHFNINGGRLKFNNLIVREFNKKKFEFIVYGNNGGGSDLINLKLLGGITTGDKLIYLTSNSETNLTNSVYINFFINN